VEARYDPQTMASASAERVRSFRQRQRDEHVLLKISVPEMPLVETLIEAGLLPPDHDHGPEAMAQAVEKLIELFVRDKMR
jgi:hypothetical protein